MRKGIIAVLSTVLGMASGAVISGKIASKAIEEKSIKADKFKSYYNMLNQWLILKQEEKSLAQYFENAGYHTIAIYGMGEMGNRLYEELKDTNIEVKYAIDKNVNSTYLDLEVFDVEDDDFAAVDAIVVTAVFAFDEIESTLKEKVDITIVSLEDVVFQS